METFQRVRGLTGKGEHSPASRMQTPGTKLRIDKTLHTASTAKIMAITHNSPVRNSRITIVTLQSTHAQKHTHKKTKTHNHLDKK